MARPLRISFNGAVFHITARGNESKKIFREENDREYFLSILEDIVKRYGWVIHAYCLMDNHYHLLIEVPKGNVSIGMRYLNGVYTQHFNKKYERFGHLFQGRFKGILVEKDNHLLELSRYIVLNPVRAKVCDKPESYKWSSYTAAIGMSKSPGYLFNDWILSQFAGTRQQSINEYKKFVREGIDSGSPWEKLEGQVFFGSKEFVEGVAGKLEKTAEIPRTQRQPLRPALSDLLNKKTGILIAYREYGYKMNEIAQYIGVHYATVSRKLRRMENGNV